MKRLKVWLPLLFALIMVLGMMIGFRLRENIPVSQSFFRQNKGSSVQEVMGLIRDKYVDSVNTDSLSTNAIQAMLAQLDPHSLYIPPAQVQEVNEDLQGNFEGVGIEFLIIRDTVNVTAVLPGGPSEKAGLQMGDKFLKVNDSVVTGSRIDADRVKDLLRGPGGSQVKVEVLREGQPAIATITRGIIPLASLDAAYMIDSTTGFIHLNKFAETTYRKFMLALQKLQKEGMKKLILDLRGNGGGILGEAVAIADEFLSDEKLIVYTRGDKEPKEEYHCKKPGLFETGKLVLLVDEGTASASEILTGALQDWDRATIIGRRTFGKGLVQEQYQLDNGAALRLTVARYYTPSGRCIQKPYNMGREAYNDELMKRFHDGEMINGDTTEHTGKAYKTHGGRTVYGGGGITPDIFIPFDTATFSTDMSTLFYDNTFSRFIYEYYIRHRDYFQQFKTPAGFAQKYQDADPAWNGLEDYIRKDSIRGGPIPVADKAAVEQRIKTWMARQIWRMEGYYEVNNRYDKTVQKALDIIENGK